MSIRDMCGSLALTLQVDGSAVRRLLAAGLAAGLAASPLLALELSVGRVSAAASPLEVALQAACSAARLSGRGPCIVTLEATDSEDAIVASSAGRALPIGLLADLGILRDATSSGHWISAERLGYGSDDPPTRLAARFPVSLPGPDARSLGAFLVFESKGSNPIDPATRSSLRILASLAGSVLTTTATSPMTSDRHAEAERSRILAELHDGLLQNLCGLGLEMEAATTQDTFSQEGRTEVHRWQGVLAGAIDETRSMLDRLSGSTSGVPELGAGLDMLAEEAAAASGMDIDTQVILGCPVPLPSELRRGVLAVAREALRNAVRHGGACRVHVHVDVDDEGLRLVVEDDGVGFAPAAVRRGHGLRSMAARAATLGGTLGVTSSPGAGVRVVLWAPVTVASHSPAIVPLAGGQLAGPRQEGVANA